MKPSAWWAMCPTAICARLLPHPLTSQSAPVVRETTTVRAYDGRTIPGEFLSIAVPERRGRPSRSITFAALRLASTARRPGTPIVFLMGGPGIPPPLPRSELWEADGMRDIPAAPPPPRPRIKRGSHIDPSWLSTGDTP